jgi:DNA (cytosine-5)-methyltransferase 3A
MRVLSLFDGISCGMLALLKSNIPVSNYYASEIEPNAIKISSKNFPEIIQLGDVTKIDFKQFEGKIDLLIGGSPCQSLSITQSKTRKNLDGKSKLFFEFVRALQEVKPKYFLLENVASMKQECKDIISSYMGVEPIFINSNCFSAQDRERYYWTNIAKYEDIINNIPDNKTVINDILQSEDEVNEKYYYNFPFEFYGIDKRICAKLQINGHDILKRVQSPFYKCHTLTCISGGNQHKKVYVNGKVRKLTPVECERLQNVPENYTNVGITDNARYSALGNGWTVNVISYIFNFLNN